VRAALLVITCGRRIYFERTLESFHTRCGHQFAHRLIVDDSGDPAYGEWLRSTFRDWSVVSHDKRLGLAGAIDTAWSHLSSVDVDFVFHLEDDFTFPVDVPLTEMAAHLKRDPSLAQVTLYRQPWSPQEHIAGGYLGLYSDDYTLEQVTESFDLFTTSRLFSFNPSLYRKEITHYRGGLEADVTEVLARDGLRFGVLAGNGGSPLCTHIGAERSPGWKV